LSSNNHLNSIFFHIALTLKGIKNIKLKSNFFNDSPFRDGEQNIEKVVIIKTTPQKITTKK